MYNLTLVTNNPERRFVGRINDPTYVVSLDSLSLTKPPTDAFFRSRWNDLAIRAIRTFICSRQANGEPVRYDWEYDASNQSIKIRLVK